MSMLKNTAVLLIGMQNDHFGQDCMMRSAIENPERIDTIKHRILDLISTLSDSDVTILNLPILFREGHPEITQQVGILATIKQASLFVEGTKGGNVISELDDWSDRVPTLSGRTGFNAFVDTSLNDFLTERGIQQLVLVGASTAVCIDSTARTGYEMGYDILILDDCTISRTLSEQDMYCDAIFPMYATVSSTNDFLSSNGLPGLPGAHRFHLPGRRLRRGLR